MTIAISATLSVSRKQKLNCSELAECLKQSNIISLVTSNISTLPHKEYGCQITQSINSKKDINNLWTTLKNRYGFECAHLNIHGYYSGCVLDYLAPSKCPGKL